MRTLTVLAVAALATAAPSLVAAAPVHAAPAKPRAELVSKQVSATLAGGRVTARATVKNKGTAKAPASTTGFYLSTDAVRSADDLALGTAHTARIAPKGSRAASGAYPVPATVPSGTYRVLACADSAGTVKERKETNNCKPAAGSVVLNGTATGPVTVSATAGAGGTVASSAVTGGSCSAGVCTFPTPGTGTVTFTPTPAATYRFGAWTGATCTGYTAGPGGAITFTGPTSARACTATFVKQVTVSFAVAPVQVALVGTVSGVASNGTCATNPLTGSGSCVVDAGVGTVALTGTALLLPFKSWSGATCDGVAAANTMTFTAPAADKACTATFGL